MENNILAGQKEASPYRQKISTSFHKDRDLSPGRPKGFCRARGDTKIRAFSFNTLPRSGDSTVSRITIHGGPRPGTAILKLSSIARKMRHKRGGFHSIKNRSSTVSFFFLRGSTLWRGWSLPPLLPSYRCCPRNFIPAFVLDWKRFELVYFSLVWFFQKRWFQYEWNESDSFPFEVEISNVETNGWTISIDCF